MTCLHTFHSNLKSKNVCFVVRGQQFHRFDCFPYSRPARGFALLLHSVDQCFGVEIQQIPLRFVHVLFFPSILASSCVGTFPSQLRISLFYHNLPDGVAYIELETALDARYH